MQAIAHESRLNALRPEPGKAHEDLMTERQHLQSLALVSAHARAQLKTPDYPWWIEYLRAQSSVLAYRSGGANGELTWPGYEACARVRGWKHSREEQDALFALDAVRRNPNSLAEERTEVIAPKAPRGSAWPKRKAVQ